MNPGRKARAAARAGNGGGKFGHNLSASAAAILSDARQALTDPALSESEAVHDLRKAFKRWRAFLRLIERPVGAPAEAMRAEARELMRMLAGARDPQSALDALDDLRKSKTPPPATSVETIRARLTSMRDAAQTAGFTAETRERLAHYLDYAALSLERWELPAIDFDAIADGLTATYRRARQLVPDDWARAEPEHLHDLRRRVVEHRHQIDLIVPLWREQGKLWVQKVQRLRNRLGACQDLEVLGRLTAPHQPLARWRSRLAATIAARRAAHLQTAAHLAARLFADKPKAFRKRVAALRPARKALRPQKAPPAIRSKSRR